MTTREILNLAQLAAAQTIHNAKVTKIYNNREMEVQQAALDEMLVKLATLLADAE